MSNQTITYLVGACLGVFGLAAFCALVLVPAITAYQRPVERVAVVILSAVSYTHLTLPTILRV